MYLNWVILHQAQLQVAAANSPLLAQVYTCPSWQMHQYAHHHKSWYAVRLLAGTTMPRCRPEAVQ